MVRSCSRSVVPSGYPTTYSNWQWDHPPSLQAAVPSAPHSAILLTNLPGNAAVRAGRSAKQNASVKQGEAKDIRSSHTHVKRLYLMLEEHLSTLLQYLTAHPSPSKPLQPPYKLSRARQLATGPTCFQAFSQGECSW